MPLPAKFIAALSLLSAPSIGSAHPGHFDNAALAHELAHAMPYLLLSIAVGAFALRQLGKMRAKNNRE